MGITFLALLHAIAVLHHRLDRVSPAGRGMARPAHPRADGLLQRR